MQNNDYHQPAGSNSVLAATIIPPPITPASPPAKSTWIRWVALFFIAGLLSIVSMLYPWNFMENDPFTSLFMLIFVSISCAFLVWAIWYLVGHRWKSVIHWVAYIVFSIAIFTGGVAQGLQDLVHYYTAVSAIQKDIILLNNIRTSNQPLADSLHQLQTVDRATGPIAPLDTLLRDYCRDNLIAREQYQNTLKNCGFTDLFSPQFLQNSDWFSQTPKIIHDARNACDQYERRTHSINSAFIVKIGKLEISPVYKKSFRRGFLDKLPLTLDKFSQYLETEQKVISTYAHLAQEMHQRQNYWSIQNHKIAFTNQSDLDHYQNTIQTIENLYRQEQKILNADSTGNLIPNTLSSPIAPS